MLSSGEGACVFVGVEGDEQLATGELPAPLPGLSANMGPVTMGAPAVGDGAMLLEALAVS